MSYLIMFRFSGCTALEAPYLLGFYVDFLCCHVKHTLGPKLTRDFGVVLAW